MISAETFFGGAHAQTLPSSPTVLRVNPRRARMWTLRAGVPGQHVKLPSLTDPLNLFTAGDDYLLIWNDGANNFDVQDFAGSVVATIASGGAASFNVETTATSPWADALANLSWRARVRTHLI